MRIKKYTAVTMKEALLQIKNDLGDDALILKTRKIPRKLFPLGEQNAIEVTAAIDENFTKKTSTFPPISMNTTGVYKPSKISSKTKPTSFNVPKQKIGSPPILAKSNQKKTVDSNKSKENHLRFMEIKDDIRQMKELLASILATGETAAAGGFAGPWAVLYKRLIDAEINALMAEDVIHLLKNSIPASQQGINERFVSILTERFPVSGPLKSREMGGGPLIVAFVGPTGAGKTTTIAKLAAYFSLNKNKAVSIITADTYRIAAIEQIRTFAEIIEIGLQVIFSKEEAKDALRACEHNDIVFVDTAGRSQRNEEHMDELKEFLEVLDPDEIHLVLSATTKDTDLKDCINRYRIFGTNRLLFTKLDETIKLGNVFNIVSKEGIAVSYLTSGQSVPDDIELAQPGRFIKRLLKGSSL